VLGSIPIYGASVSFTRNAFCSGTFLVRGLASGPRGAGRSYPSQWWAPVPEDQKAVWEILPQAAKPGQVILSKRNELGILANLQPLPLCTTVKRYASIEGFWQMMLYRRRAQKELEQLRATRQ
jgi:hypothetical protein